ncbi:sensor histidine kinase [Streptomyces lavendofoliae]|uniref:Histidine kinase n=1 Tax=Streptomyces lavendofoliae TaxID=67314 RepID=A0A918HVH9_9ACTN|nr:histidine kinase [Streptomyces lavendofoliae]GGU26741.1 histidine kinase [Streptomyces lavendofoliae]
MRITGWWSRRSNPEKVELYTRWSYHLFVLLEVASIGLGVLGRTAPPLGGWLFLLVAAHSVLGGVLASRALDWTVGRRARPDRLMVVFGVASCVLAVATLALYRFGGPKNVEAVATMVVGVLAFGIGGVVLGLTKTRHMLGLVLAAGVGTAVVGLGLGLRRGEAVGFALGVLIGGVFLASTSGFSGWLLRAVWELDAARELQARLAVAEERLRFGRDLHDVMGRNLSVIALKSELAVQLARRGKAEAAVDQMAEVQRIAQESQREVRDVVRGYREADLHTELEGARSVLAAAGIACTVEAAAVELPAPVQSALAWVVREGTTNVLRHGDARRCSVSVSVSLGAEEGCAVLVVENDGADGGAGAGSGAGGGPGAPGSGAGSGAGTGLTGLRERLAALDGTLEAGRVSGGRFRVTARVPVSAAVTASVTGAAR